MMFPFLSLGRALPEAANPHRSIRLVYYHLSLHHDRDVEDNSSIPSHEPQPARQQPERVDHEEEPRQLTEREQARRGPQRPDSGALVTK